MTPHAHAKIGPILAACIAACSAGPVTLRAEQQDAEHAPAAASDVPPSAATAESPAWGAPPIALIQAAPVAGPAPLTVYLDAGGSSDADGQVTAYRWEFGDGTEPAEGSLVVHVFDRPAVYPVTLTVRDDSGLSGETAQTIDVTGEVPAEQPAVGSSGVEDARTPSVPAADQAPAAAADNTAPEPLPADAAPESAMPADGESMVPLPETEAPAGSSADAEEPAAAPPAPAPATTPAAVMPAPIPTAPSSPAGVAGAVTISPAGGRFAGSVQVSLAGSRPDAEIHFTFDGSDPIEHSARYHGPVTVSGSITLKAREFAGGQGGPVSSALFTVGAPDAPAPPSNKR